MGRPINIVVTATKRKRERIPVPLQLRALAKIAFPQRCKEWTARLQDSDCPSFSPESLYAGDHWQIARGLPEHAAGFGWSAQLWICSPGYGLVRSGSLLHAYSANYSMRHADSIMVGGDGDRWPSLQQWWRELADWPGPEPGQPRSLLSLAQSFSEVPMLVIASKTVIKVIERDLASTAEQLRHKANLLIISGGSESGGPLGAHMLPCDARLQGIFGGARMSLNVRTAKYLLKSCPEENLPQAWARRVTDRLSDAPPIVRYDRVALTDDEVASFILRGFRSNPSASWSGLLRQLRGDGYRCEQKRFAAIFKRVASEIRRL